MSRGKAETIRCRVLLVSLMVVVRATTAAQGVTMNDVVTSCIPCHGLIVNGVVLSDSPGSFGFVENVGIRSQARWGTTVKRMVGLGAKVADVDGTAAFLANLGVEVATSTPTPTPTATSSPTATRTLSACTGNCDGSGAVTVDDIVTMVNIALGNTSLSECTAGDADDNGVITVDEIVAAVDDALYGCIP